MESDVLGGAIRQTYLACLLVFITMCISVGSGDQGARQELLLRRLATISDELKDPRRRSAFAASMAQWASTAERLVRARADSIDLSVAATDSVFEVPMVANPFAFARRLSVDTTSASTVVATTDLIGSLLTQLSPRPDPRDVYLHLRDSVEGWCHPCSIAGSNYSTGGRDSLWRPADNFSIEVQRRDGAKRKVVLGLGSSSSSYQDFRRSVFLRMVPWDSLPRSISGNADSLSLFLETRFTTYSLQFIEPSSWSQIAFLPFPAALAKLQAGLDDQSSRIDVLGLSFRGTVWMSLLPLLGIAVMVTLWQHLRALERVEAASVNPSTLAFAPLYPGAVGMAGGLVTLGGFPILASVFFARWVASRAEWSGAPRYLSLLAWAACVVTIVLSVALIASISRLRAPRPTPAQEQSP